MILFCHPEQFFLLILQSGITQAQPHPQDGGQARGPPPDRLKGWGKMDTEYEYNINAMKRFLVILTAAMCAAFVSLTASAAPNLPKVSIAGQEYYVYESKKGESLYGISNRFGWNMDRLVALNPSLAHKLKKGEKVYFPVNPEQTSADNSPIEITAESYPVIQHIVKKGDSVYSISKMYGVPVELIYLYNPSTKYGLKRGSAVTIPQEPKEINSGNRYLYYAIRPGDSLSTIADEYNTSVEQLLKDNKGVSNSNFAVGDLLRVSVNSKNGQLVTQTVDETSLARVDTYKAQKDDTWESVAQKTGVDVEDLKDFNAGTELKKNAHIDVPVMVTTHTEREVVPTDDRENTPEGLREIYNDVHMLATGDSTARNQVDVAVLIEDPKSKRDNEFVRGALLALDHMKREPYKIRLKLLLDAHTEADSARVTKALLDSLAAFTPDIVIATHEKNFPVWLAEYGEEKGVEIVNAFDVKDELYMENPSVIHLLTPSPYFTEAVAEWEKSAFPDFRLILAGKKDGEDAFAEAVLAKYEETPETSSIEALAETKLDDQGRYLIYGYPTSRDEVSALLKAVADLKEAYPLATVKVLGRPSWITLADGMKEAFANADVYFPSRFFFDHNGEEGKKFIAEYSGSFGHGPIRSYPTYAAAGYDIMNYFIEGLASNAGDFNAAVPEGRELQTPISLQRMGNWGGFFNPSAYIIRYTPFGEVEKILINS